MNDQYSKSADELIDRIARRTRTPNSQNEATPAGRRGPIHVVINRPEHCTFVLGDDHSSGLRPPAGSTNEK